MISQGWTVRASCGRCHTRLHVDLRAMVKSSGAELVLWGLSPRCRVWIDHGDGRCPGRVQFDARSIVGGSWANVSDPRNRATAYQVLAMVRRPDAPDLEHPGADPMCNNYRLTVPANVIGDALRGAGVHVALANTLPLDPPGDVRIGNEAPVVTLTDDVAALAMMKWAWPGPGGRPVFNFRSDGRSFGVPGRCLIPADAFYEFTAARPGHTRKTKWRFETVEGAWFWIAGVIKHDAFSMLTVPAGPSVKPLHDRQVVVLRQAEGLAWLQGARTAAEMLQPTPEGILAVTQAYPPPA